MSIHMKASDVAWIGEVPCYWSIGRCKDIFSLKKVEVKNCGKGYRLLSLTKKGVIARDMENPSGKFPSNYETYQEIYPGDFIFCLFDVEETPRTVGVSNEIGMITGAYTAMRLNSSDKSKFIEYQMLSFDQNKALRSLYTGMRNTIPKGIFGGIQLALPPLPEQIAIAAYLDNTTALIDKQRGLLESKRALLQEHKKALIHEAVTKGLEPVVPMKASGVDWIGEVPTHWLLKRVKEIFCEVSVKGQPDLPLLAATQHAGVIYKKDVGWRTVEVSDGGRESFKVVKSSNFVISLRSFEGGIEHSCVHGIISSAYTVLNLNIGFDRFYKYLMKSSGFVNSLQVHKKGIREGQSIVFSTLANDGILMPPIEEQKNIADFLDIATSIFDRKIDLLGKKIELLTQLRNSVIHEAVTKGVPT